MNNKKATRRALLTSITALVMCVVMLAGTTFAWFTDTATASVNKIQAGTLDVALEMADGTNEDGSTNWVSAEGKTLEFKKASGAGTDEKVLWEPGCTYELPQLRVVNNGNLALKYKVVITGIQGDAELNDVITWTIKNSDDEEKETNLAATEYKLNAKNGDTVDSDTLTISGTMATSAGNTYQGKVINGVSITVYATQDTVEYDSTANEYDKDAYVKVTPDTVQSALDDAVAGTVIELGAGDYGTLYFRQSAKSEPFASGADGTESVQVDGSKITYTYHPGRTDVTYMRTLEDITIIGCEDAKVDHIEFMAGDYKYAEDGTELSGNTIYSVQNTVTDHGQDTDWDNRLKSFFTIKNLTFKNINFTGNVNALALSYGSEDRGLAACIYRYVIDGLHFDGCTMKRAKDTMLLKINVGKLETTPYKNVSVTNCTIDGFRGIVVEGVENVTVTGNTFKNLTNQAMLLGQGIDSCSRVSGDIIIKNNIFENCKERVIRMKDALDINLTITGNTITNWIGNGKDTDYIKIQGTVKSKTVENNTFTAADTSKTYTTTIPDVTNG